MSIDLGGAVSLGLTLASRALVPEPDRVILTTDPLTLRPGQIPTVLQSQFPVRTIAIRRSVQHGGGPGFRNAPSSSYAANRDADEVTLEMQWVAVHGLDDGPRRAREALLELAELDPAGNFPLLQLTWGSFTARVQFTTLDLDLGHGVDLVTLSERRLVARCTFREASQLRTDSIADRVGAAGSTTWHVVRPTDTWAGIALEHYGTPEAGVRLAQANRARTLEPEAGKTIKVLSPSHPAMIGPSLPASPALRSLPLGAVQDVAAATWAVGPGGRTWEQLPARFTAAEWVP